MKKQSVKCDAPISENLRFSQNKGPNSYEKRFIDHQCVIIVHDGKGRMVETVILSGKTDNQICYSIASTT